MSWFSEFVKDAIDAYRKLDEAAFKAASFQEKLNTILEGQVIHSTFIGHVGERFIGAAVEKKGYEAIRSPGSRSPADIWGWALTGEIIHIPLVQVKATRKDHAPASLSDDEERKLNDFSMFVADQFINSAKVPDELKRFPLLVSAGYAGVVIDWLGMGPSNFDTRCTGAACTKAIMDRWDQWGPWLNEFYETLRP